MKLKLPDKKEARRTRLAWAEQDYFIRGWSLIIFGIILIFLPVILFFKGREIDVKSSIVFISLGVLETVFGIWTKYGLKWRR